MTTNTQKEGGGDIAGETGISRKSIRCIVKKDTHAHTHTHTWTAPSKTMDRLSLSSLSESMSEESDSGWADPRTMSLSAIHQRWYTDKPSQWTVLSGKWLCVRSHSLFLQRSMSTGTRIATCGLTRAGAASWVDFTVFTDDQSNLTAACSCCATTHTHTQVHS